MHYYFQGNITYRVTPRMAERKRDTATLKKIGVCTFPVHNGYDAAAAIYAG